jgi:uncharacterized protein (TIGR02246 family)
MTDPEPLIRTLFEHRYPEAVLNRDLEAYLALYTPDALWIRPGGQPRRGQAAIAEGFKEMLAGHTIRPTFVAEEIECHGRTATVLGRSDAVVTAFASHEEVNNAFFALWIVREQKGQWLIHRQIWTPIR